ncbi:hypothetical protein ALP86_02133 [Pseudomonas amygdali pv. mori]|nr:hypothetical protein ALP86_02133 [Pseudomonas amygdali pv. mori]
MRTRPTIKVRSRQTRRHSRDDIPFYGIGRSYIFKYRPKVSTVINNADRCVGSGTRCNSARTRREERCRVGTHRTCRDCCPCGCTYRAHCHRSHNSSHDNRDDNLRGWTKTRVAVLEGVVNLLHLPPVHVTAFFSILEPGKLWIGFDHCIDALGDRLLINLPDIDLQSIDGFNGYFTGGNQFALA